MNAPESYWTPEQTAEFLGRRPQTLARWRVEGFGPPFCRFGRRVMYRASAVTDWALAQERRSTSETIGGEV